MDKRLIAILLMGFAIYWIVYAQKEARDKIKTGQAETLDELFSEPGPSLKARVAPVTEAVKDSPYAEDLAYFYRRMAIIIADEAKTTTQARQLNEHMGRALSKTSPYATHHPKLEPIVEELFRDLIGKTARKLEEEDRRQISDLFMAVAWACLQATGRTKELTMEDLDRRHHGIRIEKTDGTWTIENQMVDHKGNLLPNWMARGATPDDPNNRNKMPTIDELINQRDRMYGSIEPRAPPAQDDDHHTGLIYDEDEYVDYLKQKKAFFSDLGFRGSGQGETRLLYKAVLALDPDSYTEKQTTGDCTSHGTRNAVDASRAYEILVLNEPEAWLNRGATEPIYGHRGHGGEGMSVYRAVKFVNETGGVSVRKRYGQIDLSKYNARTGTNWGRSGVPGELTRILAENPAQHAALVRNVDEARDAIYNGFGLTVGSDVGFNSIRDKNGFADPKGRWMHCMAWLATAPKRDLIPGEQSDEPCFLVANSWGDWNGGPKGKYAIPAGSFWITTEVASRMIEQHQAFAIGNVRGFKPKPLTDWGFGYLSEKPLYYNDRLPAQHAGLVEAAATDTLFSSRIDITKPSTGDNTDEEDSDGTDDNCDRCDGRGKVQNADGHWSDCPNPGCPYRPKS